MGRDWLRSIFDKHTTFTSSGNRVGGETAFDASEFSLMCQWSGWAHTIKPRLPSSCSIAITGSARLHSLDVGEEVLDVLGKTEATDQDEIGHEQKAAEMDSSDELHVSVDTGSDPAAGDVLHERRGEGDGDGGGGGEEYDHPQVIPSSRPPGLSYAEMSEVGWMCKRLLDQGRVETLRAAGWEVSQRHYCSPKLSPECVMILGRRVVDSTGGARSF